MSVFVLLLVVFGSDAAQVIGGKSFATEAECVQALAKAEQSWTDGAAEMKAQLTGHAAQCVQVDREEK